MSFKILSLCLILVAVSAMRLRGHKEANNYFINLDADNWIYGEDQATYEKARFINIIKHSESAECPLSKPYTRDGAECFQCGTDYPVFNLATRECQRCPKENVIVDHACQ